MSLTNDDARAWVQSKQLRLIIKPAQGFETGSAWRVTISRTEDHEAGPKSLLIDISGRKKPTVEALLKHISEAAWESYLTRRRDAAANRIWGFFSLAELRELFELFRTS
jgi:hypothetical protein